MNSNKDVYYDTAKVLIKKFIKGYNSTLFAFGQSGSGKTHTI